VFASLQHRCYAPRNPAGGGGFQVFLNNQVEGVPDFAGLGFDVRWLAPAACTFPLAVGIHDGSRSGSLTLEFDFSSFHFDSAVRERFTKAFQRLLESWVEDPDRPLSSIPLCSESGRETVLTRFNAAVVAPEWRGGARAEWSAQAAREPGRIALEQGDGCFSYGALEGRAQRLAGSLRAQGVGRGSVVPVWAERGVDLVVAWLGVWHAGGAFLPLDPRDPLARIEQIVAQCGAGIVLTDGRKAPAGSEARFASVEQLVEASPGQVEGAADAAADLAYVIYTSGSTGRPKGVLIEHGGMANHLACKIEALELGRDDCVAHSASPAFDISIWQLMAAMQVGARVRVVSDEVVRDPEQLLFEWEEAGVTVAEVVPSLLRVLLEMLDRMEEAPRLERLRWLLVTGEVLEAASCRRWLAHYPRVPLVNAYGPTECSDDVTHEVVLKPPEGSSVPIGAVLPNLRTYVVDSAGQLVEPGCVGELWVGGLGVGRGYLDDPERTKACFGTDPWWPGGRVYQTGDRAHFDAAGQLYYHGRRDTQVKLRGFRVELGEIERVLTTLPGVRAAAAVVADSRLRAFVELKDEEADCEHLVPALSERLPAHMVPARIECLHALPISPNGKINRSFLQKLPSPNPEAGMATEPDSGSAVVPNCSDPSASSRTSALCEIAARLLGLDDVSPNDDFFELGGESLLAMHLIAHARQTLGLRITLQKLVQARTMASLAALPGLEAPPRPIPRASRRRATLQPSANSPAERSGVRSRE